MQVTGQKGTLRFYGTPAEEGGSGKVYMVRAGLFNDVDVAVHWHPSDRNGITMASSLANKSGKFRFRGVATRACSYLPAVFINLLTACGVTPRRRAA